MAHLGAEGSAPAGTIYRSSRSMPVDQNSVLTALLRGIADRDRGAFATLYATLAPALWHEVVGRGFSAAEADAVLATTFVEVWQLASFHVDDDTQVADWIRRSVGRRCAERRHRTREAAPDPRPGGAETTWWQQDAARYDEAAKRAIHELLGGRTPAGREVTGRELTGPELAGREPAGREPAGREPAGREPAGREMAGPTPMRPPDDRPAAALPIPVPVTPEGDLSTTYRPRRVDLGAAAAFGHRRAGAGPAERTAG